MKKLFAILLALSLLFSLAACGSAEPDPNSGLYTGTYATMLGLRVSMSEAYSGGFDITLKDGGKCSFTIDGKSFSGTWVLNGTAFTATVQKEDYTGTLENGVIVLINVQGSGIDLIFINNNVPGADAYATSGSLDTDAFLNSLTDTAYLDWWRGDWYGWWIVGNAAGEYEDWEDDWWDIAGYLEVDDSGAATITLWDEDSAADQYMCYAELQIENDGTATGCATAESVEFYSVNSVGWSIHPTTDTFRGEYVDNLMKMNGSYADEKGSFDYTIVLRPWGVLWDDVAENDLPYYYDWYVELLEQGVTAAPDVLGPES